MSYNPEVQVSTQKAFADALLKLGAKYKNVVILNANNQLASSMLVFEKTYPDRVFNFGNGLHNMLAAATAFTVRGKIPVIFAEASALSGDGAGVLRDLIAHPNLNIKIAGLNAGLLSGQEGYLLHAVSDMAVMRAMPNLKIICPADANEARKAAEVSLLDYGPTYFRLYGMPLPEIHDEQYKFVLGRGSVYKFGHDVCLFAVGTQVHMALEAAQLLDRDGVSTMVVNMASIKPLDAELIVECAKQVKFLFTVEDHMLDGGLGDAVAGVLVNKYGGKLQKIGLNGFVESGKVDDLYRKYGLDGKGVAERVMAVVKG